MHLGLRPWPSKAKKDGDKKKDEKDKPVDATPKVWGYGEIAFVVSALAVFGMVVYKAHKGK